MLPDLDIIIVNWNSAHQFWDCLDSIVSSDRCDFKLGEVIVIDNASTDSSLDNLDDINLPLNIIKNIENKAFGAACNQGVAISKSDYFLFLNPDTKLFNDALDKAVSFMEKSLDRRVGVVGIQLVDELGKVQRNYTRFPSITNLWCSILGVDKLVTNKFTSYFMKDWEHSTTQKVDQVMGAFYLIRSEVFRLVGGFDERFFVYFEDLDLSYRVNKLH